MTTSCLSKKSVTASPRMGLLVSLVHSAREVSVCCQGAKELPMTWTAANADLRRAGIGNRGNGNLYGFDLANRAERNHGNRRDYQRHLLEQL